jgi:hypothetical protein
MGGDTAVGRGVGGCRTTGWTRTTRGTTGGRRDGTAATDRAERSAPVATVNGAAEGPIWNPESEGGGSAAASLGAVVAAGGTSAGSAGAETAGADTGAGTAAGVGGGCTTGGAGAGGGAEDRAGNSPSGSM